MDISNPTPNRADLDPSNTVDAMANLLMGGADASTQEQPQEPAESEPPTEEPVQPETEDSEETEQPDDSQAVDDDSVSDEATLASMLGLGEDQLIADDEGNIKVRVKINGKEGEVDLQGLVKGYQFDQANNAKAQDLARQRKAFEEAQTQERQRIEQQTQYAEGLAMMFQKKLMEEYQNVNWEELRKLDPGEYAARQADFNQRNQELQQAGHFMAQYREQQQAEQEQKNSEARAKLIAENREIMLQNNPGWHDSEVFERDMGNMRNFVQTQYGFTEDDVRKVGDARLIELIKDAYAFRSGKSVAEKRKTPAPPKMHRAADGRFVKKMNQKQARIKKLTEAASRAKGADKRTLETEAIATLLMGGQ